MDGTMAAGVSMCIRVRSGPSENLGDENSSTHIGKMLSHNSWFVDQRRTWNPPNFALSCEKHSVDGGGTPDHHFNPPERALRRTRMGNIEAHGRHPLGFIDPGAMIWVSRHARMFSATHQSRKAGELVERSRSTEMRGGVMVPDREDAVLGDWTHVSESLKSRETKSQHSATVWSTPD